MADRHPGGGGGTVAARSQLQSPPEVCRTCVGCRARRPQAELLRFSQGSAAVEVAGPSSPRRGRGAYLCAKMSCWER
ncbi:MAG: YlxR family protein, partial [Candidatus Dormibacteria bacterium]